MVTGGGGALVKANEFQFPALPMAMARAPLREPAGEALVHSLVETATEATSDRPQSAGAASA